MQKLPIFISTIIHVLEQTSSVCPTIGILDRKKSNTQNIVVSKYILNIELFIE